jgi:hypothetical protein
MFWNMALFKYWYTYIHMIYVNYNNSYRVYCKSLKNILKKKLRFHYLSSVSGTVSGNLYLYEQWLPYSYIFLTSLSSQVVNMLNEPENQPH